MIQDRNLARKVIATVLGAILIAVVIGSWNGYLDHQRAHLLQEQIINRMDAFMLEGNRFAASAEYPSITNVSSLIEHQRHELRDSLDGKVDSVVPQEVVLERIQSVKSEVEKNSKKLDEIERLLRR